MKIARFLLGLFAPFILAGVAQAGPIIPTPLSTPAQTVAQAQIVAIGDSLIQGNEDFTGVSMPSALAAQYDVPVLNLGIGGQVTTQAFERAGLLPLTLTFSSNTLVSGGNPYNANGATITAINGVAPTGWNSVTSPIYMPLSTAVNTPAFLSGTVCGVHGTVRRTASGGPPSTSETYLFLSDLPLQYNVACAANSTFTPDNANLINQPMILEGGRNNYAYGSQITTDYTSAVAALTAAGNSRYICLGFPNGQYTTEYSGQTNYNTITTVNASISTTCGASHFVNVWSWLLSQAQANNPADQQDIAYGVIPTSTRAITGNGTLNGAITTTTSCSIPLIGSAPAINQELLTDSEYILISAVSGQSITGCTRGYGGSLVGSGVAATHTTGTKYYLIDPLHPNKGTYTAEAAYIKANFGSILFPPGLSAVATSSAGSAMNVAPVIGNLGVPTTVQSPLHMLGPIDFPYNTCLFSYDNSGNKLCSITVFGTTVEVGTTFASASCLGNGGSGNTTVVCAQNNGLTTFAKGFGDLGYAYSQPTTGATVTIADTSDYAIVDPAGTLAALTVTLPTCSSGYDGKITGFTTTQIITALTVNATAGTVNGAPTTAAAQSSNRWICRGSNTTYYREQ